MTMEEAALMEPTAVAVHSCRRAGVELGKTVLICGAGPIGLVNVVTSLAMGATEVVVTDIDEGRLKVSILHSAFVLIESNILLTTTLIIE